MPYTIITQYRFRMQTFLVYYLQSLLYFISYLQCYLQCLIFVDTVKKVLILLCVDC